MKPVCKRCGGEASERHHIKFRNEGGEDNKKNRVWLCQGCHDFIHAEATLLRALLGDYPSDIRRRQRWPGRFERRLASLRKLNSPEKVRELGYKTYWDAEEQALTFREVPQKTRRTDPLARQARLLE